MNGIQILLGFGIILCIISLVLVVMQIPEVITAQNTITRFCSNYVTSGFKYFCEGKEFVCSVKECWYVE